jgi:shikimate dehydrogenase
LFAPWPFYGVSGCGAKFEELVANSSNRPDIFSASGLEALFPKMRKVARKTLFTSLSWFVLKIIFFGSLSDHCKFRAFKECVMSKKIKLGLLGNNLGRSRAKNLHELLGELYGLDVTYEPMDLLDRSGFVSIAAELERCRTEGFTGVNVTHPYKQEAFLHVTPMPGFPQGLTSVNTVLFTPETMLADNTDFSGFCRAFAARFGRDFKPGRVLVLGAGGVGVAIAHGLKRLGADELVVHDVRREVAQDLVSRLAEVGMAARLAQADLAAEMQNADGLVNATPIGMFQYPGNPFPAEGFGSQRWAFDAVYTPENTGFLQQCRQRDMNTLSGFHLFLYQGLDAFKHFTGVTADAEKTERLFLERYPLE